MSLVCEPVPSPYDVCTSWLLHRCMHTHIIHVVDVVLCLHVHVYDHSVGLLFRMPEVCILYTEYL